MTFHTVEAHNGEITEGKPKIDRDYCNDHNVSQDSVLQSLITGEYHLLHTIVLI